MPQRIRGFAYMAANRMSFFSARGETPLGLSASAPVFFHHRASRSKGNVCLVVAKSSSTDSPLPFSSFSHEVIDFERFGFRRDGAPVRLGASWADAYQ